MYYREYVDFCKLLTAQYDIFITILEVQSMFELFLRLIYELLHHRYDFISIGLQ